MKNQILLIIVFTILIGTKENLANKINSKINEVTVFVNGAQVNRKAKAFIKKGNNEIIIDDVSPFLNQKSIQVSSNYGIILDTKLNVEHNNPILVSEPLPEKIQREINSLEDSLFYQNLRLEKVINQIYNLSQEKKIITNNKTIRGEGKSDSLAIFIQAVEFYHKKLELIESQVMELKVKEHQLQKLKNVTERDLEELKNYSLHKTIKPHIKPVVHQIIITIFSEQEIETEFNIDYLVNRAGWVPSYDLRASSSDQPVNLTYKASIFQKTGEDWENVKLILSTFNQDCSFTLPTLAAWEIMDKTNAPISKSQAILGYETHNRDSLNIIQNGYGNISFAQSNLVLNTQLATSVSSNFNSNNIDSDPFILPKSLISSTDKTLSNISFNIKNKYSIPSNGKETMLVVSNENLKSNFDFISIPKVNTDAFLIANITEWRKLNLLPAKANIYFNNSYVGETEIRPTLLEDTLSLAMGREKAIEITRKKIEDDAKEKFTGKNINRLITIEIVIKNTLSSFAEINLKDQIPISNDDKIKVKQIEMADAQLNESTGILSWKLNLRPNETRVIKFTYEIAHDKEIEVI